MARPRATRSLPLLIAGLALLLAACSGKAATADSARTTLAVASAADTRTVTVQATGKTRAVPDQLVASLAVHSAGPTAAAVLSDINLRVRAVLDQVKQQGVDAKDVQTTQVDLGPTFDKKGNVTGFEADNAVQITFRRLSIAGRQLDAVVRTPGDAARLQSVTLGFNDDDKLLAAARVDGVRRARAQATQMVGALNANLGAVRTITETSAAPGAFPQALRNSGDGSASSVPIAPGTQELTVSVKVVFEIA